MDLVRGITKNKRLKKIGLLLVGLVVVVFVFTPLVGVSAQDDSGLLGFQIFNVEELAARIFGSVISWIVSIEGFFLWILSKLLFALVRYNGFATAPAVQIGWTIVRDVANMFFVVVLLAVAIGTILRVESYNFKRLLPKIIIMAVLVNFSLVIAGLILDAAQVVMLSFVAAFAPVADAGGLSGEANLVNLLNIQDIMQFNAQNSKETSFWGALVTALLAVILMAIALMVIVVMLVIFLIRIIMIWMLLVLSPMAFVLMAFPQGQRYASQWWQKFSQYVIVGPVLAFFLWLTFAIINPGAQTPNKTFGIDLANEQFTQEQGDAIIRGSGATDVIGSLERERTEIGVANKNNEYSLVSSKVANPAGMGQFIIAIGMLLASMMITQQLSVAGGGLAGGVVNKVRQAGLVPLQKMGQLGKAAAKAPFQYAGRKINERIYDQKLTPLANPFAMYRGWQKRRQEVYTRAREGADAGAEEAWEKAITGVAQPNRLRQQFAEQSKYASDYKFLPKEKIANLTAQLAQKPRSAENRARLRALVQTAFQEGYDDDILDQEYFRQFAPDDPETGQKKHLSKEHYLEAYTHLIGDHEAGLYTLSQGDDISHKTKHFSIAGLTETDNKTGKIKVYDGNKPEEVKKAIGAQMTEARKEAGRQRGGWHFQGEVPVHDIYDSQGNLQRRVAAPFDDLTEQMLESKLKGQRGQFVGEHYVHRSAMAEFGSDITKSVGDFDENGFRLNINQEDLHLLDNIGFMGNIEDWIAPAFFSKIGGKKFDDSKPDEIKKAFEELRIGVKDDGGNSKGEMKLGDVIDAYKKAKVAKEEGNLQKAKSERPSEVMRRILGGAAPAPAAGGTPTPAAGGPMPLAALDKERYERTAALSKQAEEFGLEDYTVMPEYQQSAANYLTPSELKQAQRAEKLAPAMSINEFARGGDEVAIDFSRLEGLDFVQGQRGLTFSDLNNEQGLELAAKLDENLDDEMRNIEREKLVLNIDTNLDGDQLKDEIGQQTDTITVKKERVAALQQRADAGEWLGSGERAELESSQDDVDKMYQRLNALQKMRSIKQSKERLKNFDQLGPVSLINTGGGREAITHERAHRDLTRIDSDGSWQLERWRGLSDQERTGKQAELERVAGRPMSETELAQEDAAVSFAEGKMTNDELRTIQQRAQQAKSTLKTRVKLKAEVEPEIELKKVPGELRSAASRMLNRLKRSKKPQPSAAQPITLTEEEKAGVQLRTYQRKLEQTQGRQGELDQRATATRNLVTTKQKAYQDLRFHREKLQPAAEDGRNNLQKLKANANQATQEAARLDQAGDTAGAKQKRTEARDLQKNYQTAETAQKALEKQLDDIRQQEAAAKQDLTIHIDSASKKKASAERNKEVAEILKRLETEEATLTQNKFGSPDIKNGLPEKLRTDIEKSVADLKSRLEELTDVSVPSKLRRAASASAAGKRQPFAELNKQHRPAEVVEAGQQVIEQEGETLKEAAGKGSNEEVINALSVIDGTLRGIQSAIEQAPKASVDQGALNGLKQSLQSIANIRQSAGRGTFDPSSSGALLYSINQNIKKLGLSVTKKPSGGSGQPTQPTPPTPSV